MQYYDAFLAGGVRGILTTPRGRWLDRLTIVNPVRMESETDGPRENSEDDDLEVKIRWF